MRLLRSNMRKPETGASAVPGRAADLTVPSTRRTNMRKPEPARALSTRVFLPTMAAPDVPFALLKNSRTTDRARSTGSEFLSCMAWLAACSLLWSTRKTDSGASRVPVPLVDRRTQALGSLPCKLPRHATCSLQGNTGLSERARRLRALPRLARYVSSSLLLILLSLPLSAQREKLPEFVHGEDCLFCHRNNIGQTWQKNSHGTTLRQKEGSTDEFVLGSRNHTRQLKKVGYGKFAIQEADGSWNANKFADRCAGCHATAVDGETRTFQYYGIDCYGCHGSVDLEHTNDTSLIILSKKRRDAKIVTSICSSCHLRGGQSKAKGFPYAFHFVAGDDLFTDFQADFAKADDATLNAGDRHVYRNVRDVLQNGSGVTCLTCHALHQNSSLKHRRVLTSATCLDCHNETGPKKNVKTYKVTSKLCEY